MEVLEMKTLPMAQGNKVSRLVAWTYLTPEEQKEWINQHTFYKHIGVYAFRKKVLLKIAAYKQGVLETAESLEQLTWLENGHKIKMVETLHECMSIDTEDDLSRARALFK